MPTNTKKDNPRESTRPIRAHTLLIEGIDAMRNVRKQEFGKLPKFSDATAICGQILKEHAENERFRIIRKQIRRDANRRKFLQGLKPVPVSLAMRGDD